MEISFYSKRGVIEHIEVSDGLFRRLARSTFSKIGRSKDTPIILDGEKVRLPLVPLSRSARAHLEVCLANLIVEEVETVLSKMGTRPSAREIEPALVDMKSLIEIRRCARRRDAAYLQRVPG